MKKRIFIAALLAVGIISMFCVKNASAVKLIQKYSMQRIGQCDICTEGGNNVIFLHKDVIIGNSDLYKLFLCNKMLAFQ